MNGDSGREIHWASTGMLHFRHSCKPPRKGTVWNAKCWSLANLFHIERQRRAESASHLPEESDIGLGNVLPNHNYGCLVWKLPGMAWEWRKGRPRHSYRKSICIWGQVCMHSNTMTQLSHLEPWCILGIAQWKELAILIGGLSRGPVPRCKQKGEKSQHG